MIWWLVGILVLVAWFMQNVTHEWSHARYAKKKLGATITQFTPWMHFYKGKPYWARVQWRGATKRKPPQLYLTSLLSALVLFGVQGVTFLLVWLIAGEDYLLYVASFVVAPFVDAMVWVWGYFWGSERTDGQRYRKLTKELYQVKS